MRSERPPAVAGTFYPDDHTALRTLVRDLLGQAPAGDAAPPKAVIAPHAGFPFSGPVAAAAYARLAPLREQVARVILLGPSHHVPFRGLATSSADTFTTPLGPITVDREAVAAAEALDGVGPMDAAHAREHSLETQLPFLQEVLGDFQLVPVVVGDAAPEAVGALLETLWGGPETIVVISSDLSHFLDDTAARERDAATARAIEALAPERIGPEEACGCRPVNGLLWLAGRGGHRIDTLDLRNSGDAGAPRNRVVGYGAFALEESAQ